VWASYFSLAFALLHHEQLSLEHFSTTKRAFVTQRHGDLREEARESRRQNAYGYCELIML
jgi:hypothetical protein